MQFNEPGSAEQARMVAVAKPVTDELAAGYDPTTVKLLHDELGRHRK